MQVQEDMQLLPVTEVGGDTAKSLVELGFATEQLVDGEKYIKVNVKGFDLVTEALLRESERWCVQLWNEYVDQMTDGSEDFTVEEAIKIFSALHVNVKELSKGQLDFCEVMFNMWLKEEDGKL
jgi:hypothetical protein